MLPGPLLPVVAEAKGDALGGVDAKGEVVDPPAANGVALVVFPALAKGEADCFGKGEAPNGEALTAPAKTPGMSVRCHLEPHHDGLFVW